MRVDPQAQDAAQKKRKRPWRFRPRDAAAEFGLTRDWSAKAEFTYIRFRERDVIASDGSPLKASSGVAEAKIGVNYRFGVRSIFVAY